MLGIRRYRDVALDLFQGDITQFACDIIVNAANEQLAGGGGVDGAIHRVGGPSLMEECREIGGCPTGAAVVTGAGQLPCSNVVHTVGPRWRGGEYGEAELLQKAYRSSLELAEGLELRHIAFPSLSTGAYGFPVDQACQLAWTAIRDHLDQRKAGAIGRVTLVLFSSEDYQAYQKALETIFPEP